MTQATDILGAGRPSHVRMVGVVAAAHFVSHYYTILLAPLLADLIATELAAPGTHAGHPFSPRRPTQEVDLETLLTTASRSLVATLEQPGGHLPFGREAELERFLAAALPALLGLDGQRRTRFEATARRLLRQAPPAESVPLLFYLAGRIR